MLLLGFLLSLAAGPGEDVVAQGYQTKAASRGGCTAALVSAPGFPKLRQKFSARTILDLQFEARGRRVEGPHVLHFKIFTPRGHLYQDIAVPFSVDPASATRASRKTARSPVHARLPVAGTAITNNSLYGKWSVVPYLDDSMKPCAAATTFKIVP